MRAAVVFKVPRGSPTRKKYIEAVALSCSLPNKEKHHLSCILGFPLVAAFAGPSIVLQMGRPVANIPFVVRDEAHAVIAPEPDRSN